MGQENITGTSVDTADVLIFDLFGVIARDQSQEEAEILRASTGTHGKDFWEAYWALRPPYDRAEISAMEYWTSVGDRLHVTFDRTLVHKLVAHDVSSWATVNDEMVGLLEELTSTHRLALLSNIPRDIAEHYVKAHKWLDLFEVRAFSNYTGYAKPAPEAYERCLGELGTEPGRTLFIDDRRENVLAAAKLGIPGHLFSSPKALRQALQLGNSPA